MNFIKVWSYSCANYLMKQLNENHEKRGVYYYGFQVIIGALVKGVLLVTISLLLGVLIPAVIGVVIFGSLRMLAGGYHMDTYGKCIWTSLALFIVAAVGVQYTYQYWSWLYVLIFLIASFILAMYVMIKWAPKDTPNKPITKPEEIRKFKRLSIMYVIGWMLVSLVLMYFKQYYYVLAGCTGIVLECFTITPIGHKFFDKISGKVDEISSKK